MPGDPNAATCYTVLFQILPDGCASTVFKLHHAAFYGMQDNRVPVAAAVDGGDIPAEIRAILDDKRIPYSVRAARIWQLGGNYAALFAYFKYDDQQNRRLYIV